MGTDNNCLVKKAAAHFRDANYQDAKTCYEMAARKYGKHLFAYNIRLCDLRMGRSEPIPFAPPGSKSDENSDLTRQLEETQRLLEHYYARCKELEYQLIDKT